MIHEIFKKNIGWKWLDVLNPTQETLRALAKTYHLHQASVYDCLDPEHLPKFESFQNISFIILRTFDDQAVEGSHSVHSLTRKVAFFVGPDYLITIHRKDQPFLEGLRKKWEEKSQERAVTLREVLHDLLRESLLTYRKPFNEMIEKMDSIEEKIFREPKPSSLYQELQEIFYFKRNASVFKRMLLMTEEALHDFPPLSDDFAPLLQDLKDEAHRLFFIADELLDDMNDLLNFHLSLSQNRTNEIIRVLTLITVFFIPLTFFVGVYGMNFHFMPELEWKWGYAGAWGLILAVSGGIYGWFRRKKWI